MLHTMSEIKLDVLFHELTSPLNLVFSSSFVHNKSEFLTTITLQADVKRKHSGHVDAGTHVACIYTWKLHCMWSLNNQSQFVDIPEKYLTYSSISALLGWPSITAGLWCLTQQGSSSHTHLLNPFCNYCANYFSPYRGFVCALANTSQLW